MCQRHTLVCFHVISCPAGNAAYLAASCHCEKAGHALLYACCSLQGTAQKHVLLLTSLHTSGIIWTFRIWMTCRIQDKEKRNTNTFSFLNLKTLDIPPFLQLTAIAAGDLHTYTLTCLCSISHQGCAFEGIIPIVTT